MNESRIESTATSASDTLARSGAITSSGLESSGLESSGLESSAGGQHLSWFGIVRLGLVQASLGAVVVLTTSTLNRIMVVELALAAMLPGALVTLHHAMQLLRPRMGYGSDVGQRRTPWIVGGMAALAIGGVGAAFATTLLGQSYAAGLGLALFSYALIGGGVSACGTSLLVVMATQVAPARRAAAATTVWIMMIAGFAITATVAGGLLEPFSAHRLLSVAGGISAIAMTITIACMWRLEGATSKIPSASVPVEPKVPFREALRQVWAEREARLFTAFIFVSMLAYSAQDLVLEPFAGAVFGFSPGASTKLAGTQHGGVFCGMLLVAIVTSLFKGRPLASLKGWVLGGCAFSGLAMIGLFVAGMRGGAWPLELNVFALGVANGAFSIAAIASMMALAGEGRRSREGTRMGIWGAAQAIAFGAGGFLGTVLVDGANALGAQAGASYALVFALEALGFFLAVHLAAKTAFPASRRAETKVPGAYAAGSV